MRADVLQLYVARDREAVAPCFADDERGAIYVEYIILVGLVALVCMPAFLALGAALIEAFEAVRATLLWPMP